MNVVAPCPLKPSSTGKNSRMDHCWAGFYDKINLDDVQDACMEIQQILQYQSNVQQQQQQQQQQQRMQYLQQQQQQPQQRPVSHQVLSTPSSNNNGSSDWKRSTMNNIKTQEVWEVIVL